MLPEYSDTLQIMQYCRYSKGVAIETERTNEEDSLELEVAGGIEEN